MEESDKMQLEAGLVEGEERGRSATTGFGNLAASFTSSSELHEGDCCFLPLTELVSEMLGGGTFLK